jgi:hypothetical protein
MTIDWKTVLTVVVTALMSAGGTVGAQSIVGAPPQQAQMFQIVKGMTGLCIRVDEPVPASAPRLTTSSTSKEGK